MYKSVLKIYFRYALRYRFLYIVFILGVIIDSILSNSIPLFYKEFISIVQNGEIQKLYGGLVLLFIILLSETIVLNILQMCVWRIQSKITEDLRLDAIKILQNQDYSYHTSKSSGRLISILSRCAPATTGLTYNFNYKIFRSFLALILPIIFIGSFSIKISLVMLLILTLSIPIMVFVLRWNLKARRAIYEPENKVSSSIIDNLTCFDTIKAFAKEAHEQKRLREYYKIYTSRLIKNSDNYRILYMMTFIISILIICSSIFIAIKDLESGILNLGALLAITGYVIAYPTKLNEMIIDIRESVKSMSDFGSFAEILNLKPTITDSLNPQKIKNPEGVVEFKNIHFAYQDLKTIDDINLKISSNESVAFVGPSGAGKSTITKLLLRYYDVQQGEILVDGINIKNISQRDLRELIGIVPQDPTMFNNTIAFNVGYALENASQEQIVYACKQAQIHHFIDSLPEKYETTIGERGIKLSGGQRQRLAIARMILKNPKILIFDEATSALDSESEQLIHKAFADLSKDKTTIIIAHRLSTIVNCDRIYVMDEGTIVQVGNHKELMKQNGIYKKLWDIQSGGFLGSI
jgi:ABC-type multidrug transport system fused ATPase/permease subunit